MNISLLLFNSSVVIHSPSPFSLRAQEMGVIGPNNQLPKKRAGRGRGELRSTFNDLEEDPWTDDFHMSKSKADAQKQYLPFVEDSSVDEALSLFPQPKHLLIRVIQTATRSNKTKVCSSRPCHSENESLSAHGVCTVNQSVVFYCRT